MELSRKNLKTGLDKKSDIFKILVFYANEKARSGYPFLNIPSIMRI